MPELLQPRVGSPWAGIHLLDLCALNKRQGKVAGGQLHGLPVREHASPSDDYPVVLGQMKSLDDLGRSYASDDLNLGGCLSTGGESIAKERTLASLPFAAAKALVAEPPQRWPSSDKHASTMLHVDQALGSQHSNGLAYRHARGLVALHEHPLGGQLCTRGGLASRDGVAELVGDLSVDRAVAASINAVRHLCPRSLSSPLTSRH